TRPLDEPEVEGVVVEQLRDDDVEPRIDLRLQVLDAGLEVAALRVALGMAAPDQAERVPALADEAHEVGTVAEPVGGGPERRIVRDVTTDGDQVFDAPRHHQLAVPRDLLPAGLDGGDVHGSLDPEPLDALDDLHGRLARPAAGARHRDEGGGQRPQGLEGAQQRRLALGGARRKELERDERAAPAEQILDLHARGFSWMCPSSPAPSPAGTSGSRSRWPSP